MPWEVGEDGYWCPSCGDLVLLACQMHAGLEPPDCCSQCGFPDDADRPTPTEEQE